MPRNHTPSDYPFGPHSACRAPGSPRQQRGVSLIIVLIVLAIVSLLGIAASQIALQGQQAVRADRDYQIAFQAAEAALVDAAEDIDFGSRKGIFLGGASVDFIDNCGTLGHGRGLCRLSDGQAPAWLKADFMGDGNNAVPYGTFTGKTFAAVLDNTANRSPRSARAPRYVIEHMGTPQLIGSVKNVGLGADDNPELVALYRITAMGFGPSVDTHAVLQMNYLRPIDEITK